MKSLHNECLGEQIRLEKVCSGCVWRTLESALFVGIRFLEILNLPACAQQKMFFRQANTHSKLDVSGYHHLRSGCMLHRHKYTKGQTQAGTAAAHLARLVRFLTQGASGPRHFPGGSSASRGATGRGGGDAAGSRKGGNCPQVKTIQEGSVDSTATTSGTPNQVW